ncbi:hypothetical protein DXT63_05200 [Thermoanaerobacteraceae bacterium SP2]|jgi:sulfur carrier protein ThiS|nr:hypothetical protein DXT63_05200 [Thermoanaerobacteraceae bacterium SP2]
MDIHVKLYGLLRRYGNENGGITLHMVSGITVQDVLNELKIPKGFYALTVVNGSVVKPETKLEEDKIEIIVYPPVNGG